jgi:hypothetical protein
LRKLQGESIAGPGTNAGKNSVVENGSKDIENGKRNKMTTQLKKKRNKFGQQIDRYWKIRDVQRAIKVAGILTDPKSKLKEAKKLLNETQ